MLERETSKAVNELIRGMTRYCISAYQKGERVCSEDIDSLANLITAVNSPEQMDSQPAIGFIVPTFDDEDEEE